MKPMTEVLYSSMPLDESRNIFQSVLAKQSRSVASASSDHFRIESLVLPALVFACMQESGGYNYGQIYQMEGGGELVCISVCGVKVVLDLFFPGCTCDMLVKIW